jgi:phosphoribosylformylglycinamidine synthase subunit PurL
MDVWAAGVESIPLRELGQEALDRLSEGRGLGFDRRELLRIQEYFRRANRDPTDVELAGLAQSWSEHCSYKSSRPFFRRAFAGLHPPRVLGTGDAGVMRFPAGSAYALRIESHNHPSAIEPYGGAATGIGGILRDVLAVGARPIALTDPLAFGPLDTPQESVPPGAKGPRYIASGVISGIRDYGNRVGVPTISGGIYFDPAFVVNPLVNVGCVGWLPEGKLLPNRADRAGDRLLLVGGRTGRDGIGGVAFASRELSAASESESRGAVQLGNPILKEPLIRASLVAYERGLVRGVKDLGGGGLATASGELAHAGGVGLRLDLGRVPLREEGLRPWEIWISESQERMLLDVRPHDEEEVVGIFRDHDVLATSVGEVVRGPYETIEWNGAPAAHLRLAFRVAPPTVARPHRRRPRSNLPSISPEFPEAVGALLEELLLAPDVVSREPVIRVYDHEVRGRTAVKPLHGRVASPGPGDASVLQPRVGGTAGLAVTTAANPWACREDPYRGAVGVVEEAARNLYAVGAVPDAFSDCLNFGSPEDPLVLGDFAEVVRGLADGARALGFAVPSGNVSFYNGGLGSAIPPSPVLLATGIVRDLADATTSDLKRAGDRIYLLGPTHPELGGSLYARRRGLTGLEVPRPDPAGLHRLGGKLLRAIDAGCVVAAHDVSDGGLGVAVAEMAFGGGLGFLIDLERIGEANPGAALVPEGGSRLVVEVRSSLSAAFERRMRGTPLARLGSVADRRGLFSWGEKTVADLDLEALYPRWRSALTLP